MKLYLVVFTFILSLTSFGQMILSGTATGGCDCYTLTTTTNQSGSIWSPETIDLTNSFDFTFSINAGAADGGADGMVFVLRQSGTTTGGGGSLLGYSGITSSIGIEVDTWNSDPFVAPGDIPSDHIGMSFDGAVDHSLQPAVAIPNIEDGATHDFRVIWDPVGMTLETVLDGVSIFVYSGDLVTTFFGGDPNVYFGWTASTGGASNVQSVCIDLESDFEVDDITACPGQELDFTNTSISDLIYDGEAFTEYSWNFGGGDLSDLENPVYAYETIGSKTVGLYVTNLIGCVDLKVLNITVDSIDIEVSSTDITCFGADNGTATASSASGEAPFEYLWDDPAMQITETATGLGAGVFNVLLTDANGCEQMRPVLINEPDELVLDAAEIINATCGLNDGELTLLISGGVLPYEYSFDGGLTFSDDNVKSDIAAGSVAVVVRDDNDCLFEETFTITANDLDVTTTQVNVTCFGFDNGNATAIPAFDVGPCSYLWDDPLAQTTSTAIDLAPGVYTVNVTHDAFGCGGFATVTIIEPAALILNPPLVIDASCGVNNGEIILEATGGTLPYEYSIDGGAAFSLFPDFSELSPGTYSVFVQDANGCTVSTTIDIVNVSNVPDVILNADNYEGCKALTVSFSNLSDPLLTNITEWDFGDGSTAIGTSVSHVYSEAGCYDVAVTITTFDGCTTEAIFEDYICVWELPVANFSFSPEDPTVLDNEVNFINESDFAVTYDWMFGDGGVSSETNPLHIYSETGNLFYPVQLIAYTDKGCSDTLVQTLYIAEVINYFIPNAFTPDGDDFNQYFQPVFNSSFIPADFHIILYNRWGEIMWESYDYNASWDGTFAGELVQDGVYIWHMTFRENKSDKKYTEYGHVTILK